jgi:acrylyl-CoA reductase (NADPH)
MSQLFNALWVEEVSSQPFQRRIIQRSIDDLPAGDVLIEVNWSSLNFKDALSATGNKGVTRHYPHTPGIDAAGVIVETQHPDWQVGEEVIVTGHDLGMNTAGGYGRYIRVPADWLVRCPDNLSLQTAMLYGTAGLTAAISVYRLRQHGILPETGEILVTGASGGVGSIGVGLLAHLGYRVVAATGKIESKPLLERLGAHRVIGREELIDSSMRPLLKARWAGVLDTVGGNILATALKSVDYAGAVTCCGLVASAEFTTSVFPFILRGITLIGVESMEFPADERAVLWTLMANEWRFPELETLMTVCDLETLNTVYIDKILHGQIQGRIVVKLE